MAYVHEIAKINLEGKILVYKYNIPKKFYFEINKNMLISYEKENIGIKKYDDKFYLISSFNKDKYIITIKAGDKFDKSCQFKIISIYNSENNIQEFY